MSGDFSRIGFDPQLDDFGVLWQQGRPVTDRDCNDLVLQSVRRIHAGMLDTVGPEAVPDQTQDAFKITDSGGSLTIERGRMYVDGLLAENHGAPPGGGTLSWDPHLAEIFGSAPLDYAKQPYDPDPPALPTTGGPFLVYLDVWQREVSHHMREGLVDSALGVDTTARLQTVWQVKVLEEAGTDCETAFDQALPSSAGRLTSDTAEVPGQPDPCEIPPASGYKGQENQLYRVEIHHGGPLGTATFKWSRDNASVETRVTGIPSLTQLVVDSVGKDNVLRFSDGDWIEIIDDWIELHNQPGLLRRIKIGGGVDDVSRTITLDSALPPGQFPVDAQNLTDPARHTRIRRWDQKKKIFDAGGNEIQDLDVAGPPSPEDGIVVPAAGVQVLLEQGIVVSFSLQPTNGEFHSGDWWVFAARAGDTSIEELHEAPPRGIHHHYAHLGVWEPDSGEVTDCRVHWPPECDGCCCTVNVAPGESIQAALDSLPAAGGCVCLKTGVHQIDAAVEIGTANVILQGESPGVIVRSGSNPLLRIGGGNVPVTNVAVESIRFEATGADNQAGVILYAESVSQLRVEHCEMVVTTAGVGGYVGAALDYVSDVSFTRNLLKELDCGVQIGGYAARVEVSYNRMEGISSDAPGGGTSAGAYGVLIDGETLGCRVQNNIIRYFLTGVFAPVYSSECVVTQNQISRSAGPVPDNVPTGIDALRQYLDTRFYAIDIEAPNSEIRGNHIDLLSANLGGIRIGGAQVMITDNILLAEFHEATGLVPVPAGIYCTLAKKGGAAHDAVVRNNLLLGPQAGIVISRIDGATAAGNRIDGNGSGWYGVLVEDGSNTLVQENTIQEVAYAVHLSEGGRNRVLENGVRDTLFGITASMETDFEASGNALFSCIASGSLLIVRRATTMLHNRTMNCAYAGPLSFGMLVIAEEALQASTVSLLSGGILRIEDCEVIDTGIGPDGKQVNNVPVFGIAAWVLACQITDNRVAYMQRQMPDAAQPHRALLLIGPIGFHTPNQEIVFGSALVNGNHLRGPGRSALVEFRRFAAPNVEYRFEKVIFSNNVCDHLSAQPDPQGATVQLLGAHLIAMGNQVKAQVKAVFSMSLANGPKNVLMGNVTTGQYLNTGTVVPSPINNFNVFV
jgi:nitrous oxidase accessory protein NosD